MKHAKIILFITSFFLLAGCSLFSKPITPNTYVMVASAPKQILPKLADNLRIDYVRSSAPFNSTEMVYRVSDVKFESDYYNRFISEPETIVGNQIAIWLAHSGLYGAVSQPQLRTPSKQILQIVITKLFADFRDKQQPAAVMEMQFVLIENTSIRPEVVLEKTLSSRIHIDAKDPALLAQGYGLAMTDIFEQLALQLRAK